VWEDHLQVQFPDILRGNSGALIISGVRQMERGVVATVGEPWEKSTITLNDPSLSSDHCAGLDVHVYFLV